MMPMRRILGRFSCALCCGGGACRLPVAACPFAGGFWICPEAMARPRSSLLERVLRRRLENLGQEVLLQVLPLVIDIAALQHIERVRLLDATLDDDALGDAIDLLSRGGLFD